MNKKKSVIAAIAGVIVAWHVVLAWGAYHGTNVRPEETVAVKACLKNFALEDLKDDSPADQNIEDAIDLARQNGLADESGQVNWKVIQYVLVNRYNYSPEQAMQALESLQRYSDSEFRDCRSEYLAAGREYNLKEAMLREGLGWVESPKPIFLWSRFAIGKWEDLH